MEPTIEAETLFSKDTVIDEETGDYSYDSGDTFTGSLEINLPADFGVVVDFDGSIFTAGTILTIKGYSVVSFIGCNLNYNQINFIENSETTFQGGEIRAYDDPTDEDNEISFLDYAKVTFQQNCEINTDGLGLTLDENQDCHNTIIFDHVTVDITEIEHPYLGPHRCRFTGDSKIEITHSTFNIHDTLFEFELDELADPLEYQVIISDNSEINMDVGWGIEASSKVSIKDSTTNGGTISLGKFGSSDHQSVLKIEDSTVISTIMDLSPNTKLIVRGASTVINSIAKVLKVTGDLLISDDKISESSILGSDYTYISEVDTDGLSDQIFYTYVPVGFPGSTIEIDSSKIYALTTASSAKIYDSSEIIDSIHPGHGAKIEVEDSTLSATGGYCNLYGSIGPLAPVTIGDRAEVQFKSSTVQGLIYPLSSTMVLFQNSQYDEFTKTFSNTVMARFPDKLLGNLVIVDMISEVELKIWGYIGPGGGVPAEYINTARLWIDGTDYGHDLHFFINPIHSFRPENHIQLIVYTDTMNFYHHTTANIVDDDINDPEISLSYDGDYTSTNSGSVHFSVSDDTATNVQVYLNEFLEPLEYLGEQSFTSDQDGMHPNDWFVYEHPSLGDFLEVQAEKEGHQKVVKLEDQSPNSGCTMIYSHPHQTRGIVEFWIYADYIEGGVNQVMVSLYDKGNTARIRLLFVFDSNPSQSLLMVRRVGNTDYQSTGKEVPCDEWHHVRIEFDCWTNKYSLWLNNALTDEYNMIYMKYPAIPLASFRADTVMPAGTIAYMDAVDFSWSANYYPNRNFEFTNTEISIPSEIGDYIVTVKADEWDVDRPGDQRYVEASYSVTIAGSLNSLQLPTPDLDLHIYDNEGRHVGVNYSTGEIEILIPGASYSGDFVTGTEWIYVPYNVTEYYVVVDARDAHYPEEEYQLTITTYVPEVGVLQSVQNETILAGESNYWVPEISNETGELIVTPLETAIMEEIIDQLYVLEEILEDVDCFFLRYILLWLIGKAILNMGDAQSLYLSGNTSAALIKAKIAKVQVCISEFIIELADYFDILESEVVVDLLMQINIIQSNLKLLLEIL